MIISITALYFVVGGVGILGATAVLVKIVKQNRKRFADRVAAEEKQIVDGIESLFNRVIHNTYLNIVYPHKIDRDADPLCPKCTRWTHKGEMLSKFGYPFHWWYCKCKNPSCGYDWFMIANDDDHNQARTQARNFLRENRDKDSAGNTSIDVKVADNLLEYFDSSGFGSVNTKEWAKILEQISLARLEKNCLAGPKDQSYRTARYLLRAGCFKLDMSKERREEEALRRIHLALTDKPWNGQTKTWAVACPPDPCSGWVWVVIGDTLPPVVNDEVEMIGDDGMTFRPKYREISARLIKAGYCDPNVSGDLITDQILLATSIRASSPHSLSMRIACCLLDKGCLKVKDVFESIESRYQWEMGVKEICGAITRIERG